MSRVLILSFVASSLVACSSDVSCPGATIEDPDIGACVCPPGSTPIDGGYDCVFEDASVDPDAGVDARLDATTPDAGPAPATPRAWYPWNGYRTGSVHGAANGTLRPTFEWDAADDATDYQIQLDDSCTSPGFAECAFDSPELDERTSATVFRPEADLPVSMTAPVGRRYYWRVRGCRGERCGEWSSVMYLNVGRTECDLNGDGYADFVPIDDEVSVDVHWGLPSGGYSTTRAWSSRSLGLTGEVGGPDAGGSFPLSASCGGDIDGDGRADLVIGASEFVRVGSSGGYGNSTVVIVPGAMELGAGSYTIADPTATPFNRFGFGGPLDSGGDIDGDGLDDIVVSASRQDNGDLIRPGRVFVFRGAARVSGIPHAVLRSPSGATTGFLGDVVVSRTDVDGDGTSDVAALVTTAGVLVFGGPDLELFRFEESPSVERMAIADLDGDRRMDLVSASFTRARLALARAPEPIEIVIDGALRPWFADIDGDGVHDLFIGNRPLRGSSSGIFSLGPRPGLCSVIGVFDRSIAIDACFVEVGMLQATSSWLWTDGGWSGPLATVRANHGLVAM
jgi:hypothetical protein